MSDAGNEKSAQEPKWPARVIRLQGDYRLIFNRGTRHGVRMDQRYLVYEPSDEEIVDPVSNRRLGKLELPRGTGRVVNVGMGWAMIESDMFTESGRMSFLTDMEGRRVLGAEEGDLVKPV